ncbi:MAG TPA: erythromycin esterase family protein [Coleofasciculaceae cyanobacterium]
MTSDQDQETIELVRHAAHPLSAANPDYKALMQAIGDARIVLLGEATHGTHEFYRERTLITRMLIQEKGFSAVAMEADWPDSYEVNRFVRDMSEAPTPMQALEGFKRFPTWMWRNTDVVNLVSWLRDYNRGLSEREKVGFYGLDLYSLFTSIHVVIDYLDQVDPRAAQEARRRYGCFDHFGKDMQSYGFLTSFGLDQSCEQAVVGQLVDLRQHALKYAMRNGRAAEEAFFNAEQNARLALDAEKYYRSMFKGNVESWNMRDTHMFETLHALLEFLSREREAKVIVWAHNSHVGDARATEMGMHGELNIGQLARQHFQEKAFLIGFSTYTGTVTAASDWDGPVERKHVRRALPGSYEQLFHETGIPHFLLISREDAHVAETLRARRLERAIGVIYLPGSERQSHYFYAQLSEQFDALIHFDETRAVEPLETTTLWHEGEEVPETFPTSY